MSLNRAARAKAATQLFTRGAGVLRPAGAPLDRHGNAAGMQYELGTSGAFRGLSVVVIQQHQMEWDFKFDYARAALLEKGFTVQELGATPTLDVLKTELCHANQLWLISSRKPILTEEQVRLIADEWRAGLSVYIFGDNEPYYVDANRVLKVRTVKYMRRKIRHDHACVLFHRKWGCPKCMGTTPPDSTCSRSAKGKDTLRMPSRPGFHQNCTSRGVCVF